MSYLTQLEQDEKELKELRESVNAEIEMKKHDENLIAELRATVVNQSDALELRRTQVGILLNGRNDSKEMVKNKDLFDLFELQISEKLKSD